MWFLPIVFFLACQRFIPNDGFSRQSIIPMKSEIPRAHSRISGLHCRISASHISIYEFLQEKKLCDKISFTLLYYQHLQQKNLSSLYLCRTWSEGKWKQGREKGKVVQKTNVRLIVTWSSYKRKFYRFLSSFSIGKHNFFCGSWS